MPGFGDLFDPFAAVGEGPGKVMPEGFHPVNRMGGAVQDIAVSAKERIMKGSEPFAPVGDVFSTGFDDFGQKRVGHDASTGHPTANGREAFFQALKVGQAVDVAVVYHRMRKVVEAVFECGQVRQTGVHLDAGAGMNNDFRDGIPVENRDQLMNFRGIEPADSGFDTEFDFDVRHDLIEKSVNPIRMREQSRSPRFFDHAGIRAAQIPVDPVVSQIGQAFRHPDEIFGRVAQDLRDDRQGAVFCGENVA